VSLLSRASHVAARALALAVACSLTLASCSSAADQFAWRKVALGQRVRCLPVAFTLGAQERGLMGVKHVVRPMVFAYSPPSSPSFWMKDTPAALTGVWVGASGRVIGYWHGVPESTKLHPAPAPVSAVIEYRAGAPVPPIGTRYRIRGKCPRQPGGL
jgi:uncharacterized membrane protein (UPF0127 family)